MKHIREVNNKYVIQKCIDGKNRRFGTYDRLCDAQRVRDLLQEIGWGYKDIKPLNPMRHICKVKCKDYDYYRIVKQKNKKIVWCSHHQSLEEAMSERDLLESVDWDVDLL